MNSQNKHIGLIAAMPEEIGSALENISDIKETNYGDLTIYSGKWFSGSDKKNFLILSIVWSGWGKVSAARAATRLISVDYCNTPISFILFTGLAGAIDSTLNQSDIVIPDALMMHDMDARPLFKKYEIPALKKEKLIPDYKLSTFIEAKLKKKIISKDIEFFKSVRRGLIATGDKFISNDKTLEELSRDIPDLVAVEMEGASVAQVATQENIPWVVIRVISDGANNEASLSFSNFLNSYKNFSWQLIESLLVEFINYQF